MSSFEPSQTPTPVLKSSVGVKTRSARRAAYSHGSQNRIKKATTKRRVGNSSSTDKMQSERPRQRTFTSCTECRRRKQRVTLPPSHLPIPFSRISSNTTNNKAVQPSQRPTLQQLRSPLSTRRLHLRQPKVFPALHLLPIVFPSSLTFPVLKTNLNPRIKC